ncbi:MAG: hypothetical protein LBT50_08265 [Prevotellaceae bacterium]|jgi:hypothetical protein|nr:hypothetical protein [Prevotellaceae bacterium]
MALDNLVSVKLTADELARIDSSLSDVENILKDKAINLTPKQRQLYGRVAYEMEVWVDKVFVYMQQDPQLVPSYIDMVEHTADIAAHHALNPRIERINSILQSMEDTNRLLGTDIHTNSLAYYRSLREAAKVNAVGATAKYTDLKRQFPGNPTRKKSGSEAETE